MAKINEGVEFDLIPTTPDAEMSCGVCHEYPSPIIIVAVYGHVEGFLCPRCVRERSIPTILGALKNEECIFMFSAAEWAAVIEAINREEAVILATGAAVPASE